MKAKQKKRAVPFTDGETKKENLQLHLAAIH